MGRVPQPEANKGSQKWIQKLVNDKESLFNSFISRTLEFAEGESINWLSPRKSDKYAEYRDQAFLDKLEIRLAKIPLEQFWPARGPQWDAFGKTSRGQVLLVEAKSHISELLSSLQAESTESKTKIQKSLEATKLALNYHANVDWSQRFYQYTNRLAHLYLLRENNIPAYLVFVYFLNDAEMKGPSTVLEWKGAEQLLHSYLGLGRNKLRKFIIDVYIDVRELQNH
ncbi:MAG: hypothetical protein ABSB71_12485 [Candidatus Bathyarchaeia archaeon]|jgi:hypothetical protein